MHSFSRLRPEAQTQVIRAVEKLIHETRIQGKNWSTFRQQSKEIGAMYSYRASKNLRILLNRVGTKWQLVEFVRRGEKRIYNVSV